MISFIPSLETISVVLPDPNIFLWIAASVAAGAAVNPNGIKMLLVKGLSTFPIKGNPIFHNSAKSLPRNPPDFPILCNWVFGNFILGERLFAIGSFAVYCVLVYLDGKKMARFTWNLMQKNANWRRSEVKG